MAAAIATALVRPGDLVARYGGEEFVVLLPETGKAGAVQIAERIRSQVEALHLAHGYSATSAWVTVSVGLASTCPCADAGAAALLELADSMLYRAKNAGRNRVCSATAPPET